MIGIPLYDRFSHVLCMSMTDTTHDMVATLPPSVGVCEGNITFSLRKKMTSSKREPFLMSIQ